jgi:hypothetical protein
MLVLGLPNAELWAALAMLLRYIPYVGTTIASLLPAMVAFAIFPGWSKPAEVIGAFIGLDQVMAHMVEPFVIGSGIDLSPAAVVVSTIYWAWLWGLPGLLLAIPITACLTVTGEHVPSLSFFPLLLGADRYREIFRDFYRMLMEQNTSAAAAVAIRYCEKYGLEPTFDRIVKPTINDLDKNHRDNALGDPEYRSILQFIRELLPALGDKLCEPDQPSGPRVLGICPQGEEHSFGLVMILQLFRSAGASTAFAGENCSTEKARKFIGGFHPNVVCLSCNVKSSLAHAVELTTALKREFPKLTIIAGGLASRERALLLLRAGCSEVCINQNQTRLTIQQLSRTRSQLISPSQASAASGQ